MWLILISACTGPMGDRDRAPVAGGPSVLWVSLDTTRADHLGVYGGPAATPTLAAWAARAIVYDRLFTPFPETGLAHWAMLTGVLPEVHGNVPGAGESRYTGPTAAELAKAHGYATAAFIGGITLRADATGLNRGFDLYDDRIPSNPEDRKRDGDEVVAEARAWLGKQTQPWFAFVHLFDAHFPYTPDNPQRYDSGYAGRVDGSEATLRPYRDGGVEMVEADRLHAAALYDAELTELDASLAPLLAAVPDDVIVVITADHGESFEHGYLFNHRGSLGDGVLHIPGILRVPGIPPAHVTEPVSGVDLLPTVAAAAGWTLSGPVNGRVALPGAAEGSIGVDASAIWARTDPWMVTPLARGLVGPLLALRTAEWKVVWAGDGSVRGYDLVADPGEERAVDPPQSLLAKRAEYDDALGRMAGLQGPVRAGRVPGLDQGPMLEALGYVDPSGSPPRPGAPPGRASGQAPP